MDLWRGPEPARTPGTPSGSGLCVPARLPAPWPPEMGLPLPCSHPGPLWRAPHMRASAVPHWRPLVTENTSPARADSNTQVGAEPPAPGLEGHLAIGGQAGMRGSSTLGGGRLERAVAGSPHRAARPGRRGRDGEPVAGSEDLARGAATCRPSSLTAPCWLHRPAGTSRGALDSPVLVTVVGA